MNLTNQTVVHKIFGEGTVVEHSGDCLTVRFSKEEKRFITPDVFTTFLKCKDEKLQAELEAAFAAKQEAKTNRIEARKSNHNADTSAPLTHEDLVKLFDRHFAYSLIEKNKFDEGIEEDVLACIMKDVQFRALVLKKDDPQELSCMKAELSDYIKTHFWQYFHSTVSFDDFHRSTCHDMIAIFSKRYQGVQYGKAQKAVNMLFKYFYCFLGSEQMEQRFEDCHIPLDANILTWYRAHIDASQSTPWSFLDEKEYLHIQDRIKTYVQSRYPSYTVLQAEFIIWHREICKGITQ